MKLLKNYIWNVYWRLTIIEEVDRVHKYCRRFKCICSCGNYKITDIWNLTSWKVSSCLCLQYERLLPFRKKSVKNMQNLNITHWMSSTRFYRIWRNLLNRCNYKKHPEFKYWGWRWIKCEWEDFKEFKKDMYESYIKHCDTFWEKQTSIDRKDVNWNYCKINCRWATSYEQAHNKR